MKQPESLETWSKFIQRVEPTLFMVERKEARGEVEKRMCEEK